MSGSNLPLANSQVRLLHRPALKIELQPMSSMSSLDAASGQDEIEAATRAASPNVQVMSDVYGPPAQHPVETNWGPLCGVMLRTFGRDAAFQLLGGGVGTLAMSALPLAAMPYVAPLCVTCAGAMSLYGCYMAGKGIRSAQPEDASQRNANCKCDLRSSLACAVGFTGGAACAGMAAAGLAASSIETAGIVSGVLQLGVRCIRTGVRDSLKLTQFHGHLTVLNGGVRHAQIQAAVSGGVSSTDHRTGSRGKNASGAVA